MKFLDQLRTAERQNGSLLCVGLDPEPAKFPDHLRGDASRIFDFCAAIVDATADLVIAFKPQGHCAGNAEAPVHSCDMCIGGAMESSA